MIIVGVQAEHTLGRRIAERRREVRIFGVMRTRDADVEVLVHGEPAALSRFAGLVTAAGFPAVDVPTQGDVIRL